MKTKLPSRAHTGIKRKSKKTSPPPESRIDFQPGGIDADMREFGRLRESSEHFRLVRGILEATSDGILAVNLENKAFYANQRFTEMWMIPQAVIDSGDDALLIQTVLDQLSNPQVFLKQVRDLYKSDGESFDTLHFKDGRVFERYSRPLHHEGQMQGRVWSFRDVTSHRQIADALAASEAELRALFASMVDVVIVVSRDGVCQKIAPTNPDMHFKPPGELPGRNLTEVFPAEEAGIFMGIMEQVLETRQSAQIEYELPVRNRNIWFQATISALGADDTLWVAHNITNRKRAERLTETLYEISKAVYSTAGVNELYQRIHRLLLNIIPADNFFIALRPNDGKYLHFPYFIDEKDISDPPDIDVDNSQSLTVEVLKLKRPLLLNETELKDRYETGRNKVWGTPPKCWLGIPLMLKDHAIGVMAIQDYRNSDAFSQKDEALLEMAATQIAIAIDRKQSEEALQTAEANYRSIFENATVGICQSSPEGRFLKVNPVMAYIFGYDSPQEMLESIASIETQYYFNAADRREFQRLLLEQGEAHEYVSLNIRKDGRLIWAQENARAVHDARGNLLHYEGFITDITERKQAEEELRRAKEALEAANFELIEALEREKLLACTDGLTGLHNRSYFFKLAVREFHTAMRHRRSLAFLMFDMDGFKQVNDTLGHAAGDRLLELVARVASSKVRASDVVARYGGDEFIVLLPTTSAQQALPVAERIRASVESLRLDPDADSQPITLSIGIAEICWSPLDENVERIIQRADEAMYKAKQGGRNRTVIFGQDARESGR